MKAVALETQDVAPPVPPVIFRAGVFKDGKLIRVLSAETPEKLQRKKDIYVLGGLVVNDGYIVKYTMKVETREALYFIQAGVKNINVKRFGIRLTHDITVEDVKR